MTVLDTIREVRYLCIYKSNGYLEVLCRATEFLQFIFLALTEKKIRHECLFKL
jgi:hypothetical protein